MSVRIRWRVSEAPTGPYRSFHWRGWPMAYVDGQPVAMLGCVDDYVPRNVREGRHAELECFVADRSRGPRFRWRRLRQRARTLDEAKRLIAEFVQSHPKFVLGETA